MIDGLEPYSAYKDSGMPWLGQVPEHWEVDRLKSSAANVVEQTDKLSDGDLYVALEHVESWTGRLRQDSSRAEFDSQVKRFRSGDVLFGKLRPYLAKVCRPTQDGVCVGEFFVFRPRTANLSPPYLEHLLRSKPIIDAINRSTFGAKMPRADWQFVGGMDVLFPPVHEQLAIVRFLDRLEHRIQRFVRAKQKLIRLLNEQRQAIIQRVLTRGLDPSIRLKPSGVPWQEDVPEHWEVKKLRDCGRIVGGMTPSMSERSFWGGDIPWVTPKDMKRPVIADSQERVTRQALERTSLRRIPPGAVLLVVRGMILARRVPIARTESMVTVNQDMKAIIPYSRVLPGFLAHTMDAAQDVLAPLIDEAGHGTRRLPTERWRELRFAFPPVEEQEQILKVLDSQMAAVAGGIDAANREIALLREFRTRLIADVVTGKLDVRDAAARLPDEVEERESFDEVEQAAMKIQLPQEDAEIGPVPAAGGGRKPEPELDRLSNILKAFNDQFGDIPWSDADRVHKLITEDIPSRVAADTAYQNARKNSDKQNARIEHDKALSRVMTALLKDDTELFKQFMDNDSFRRWLTDTVFGLTYGEMKEGA